MPPSSCRAPGSSVRRWRSAASTRSTTTSPASPSTSRTATASATRSSVDVGWSAPVHGVVDHIGLFSTRVRDASSTMHFSNHALSELRNLSQEATTTTLRLAVDGSPGAEEVADADQGSRRIVGVDRRDLPRRHRGLRAAHRAGRGRRAHAQAARRPRSAAAHRARAARAGRRPRSATRSIDRSIRRRSPAWRRRACGG